MKLPFKSIFVKEDTNKPSKKSNVEETRDLLSDLDYSAISLTSSTDLLVSNSRSRRDIYQQWLKMEKDPIISTALKAHVTAALGGHETKGDLVFIETESTASNEDKKIIEELKGDLQDRFNDVAFSLTYNAIAFGDAYLRTYFEERKGLVACQYDELLHPSLVLPYEQAGLTKGFLVNTDGRSPFRLNPLQVARLKMPRIQLIPQDSVLYKTAKVNLVEDDVNKLPYLPALVGGSFLYPAEKPFNDLYTALAAIVGQRWVDSIDEGFLSVNLTGGSPEQQTRLKESIIKMLKISKSMADKAVNGEPVLSRTRHVIFTTNEKQIVTSNDGLGSKRANTINIDDIMLHARLTAGALGVDLSMLGFADQLSGGLGEGGFFRTSAQIAEGSRMIRVALDRFFHQIIDNHMMFKYGKKFNKANRPYDINFYGSISAYESEKQRTKLDAINSSGLIVQTISQLKDVGFGEKELISFMTKQMLLDEEEVAAYAKSIASQHNN
ncbi:hypothetical protein, partial [Gallibacterium sp. AGMB14963]|uniref:hypothetical protein n=1 Tax=Gallibacterium faecale TaxID=3019086 RepID=UPI0022F1AE48